MNSADESSAFRVSLTVFLYSGAKVAAASGAVDQIMIQIHTTAICTPPQAWPGAPMWLWRLAVVKSPLRKGSRVKLKSGTISRRPAT